MSRHYPYSVRYPMYWGTRYDPNQPGDVFYDTHTSIVIYGEKVPEMRGLQVTPEALREVLGPNLQELARQTGDVVFRDAGFIPVGRCSRGVLLRYTGEDHIGLPVKGVVVVWYTAHDGRMWGAHFGTDPDNYGEYFSIFKAMLRTIAMRDAGGCRGD